MLRPRLDMPNALAPQFLLELRRPAPGRILPPIVGQDLLGHAVLRVRPLQRVAHQEFLLVPRHRPADDEPRVVVHERAQVHALMAPQQEGEDIRLPELIRLRPLETSRLGLRPRCLRRRLHQIRFVQHPPHFALADRKRLEALQHVANPPRAVFRVRLLHRQHRFPARVVCSFPLRCPAGFLRKQRLVPARGVRSSPQRYRRQRQPERPAHIRHCRACVQLLQDLQLQLQRVRLSLRRPCCPLSAIFALHVFSFGGWSSPDPRRRC
jgi:hypothetical protein